MKQVKGAVTPIAQRELDLMQTTLLQRKSNHPVGCDCLICSKTQRFRLVRSILERLDAGAQVEPGYLGVTIGVEERGGKRFRFPNPVTSRKPLAMSDTALAGTHTPSELRQFCEAEQREPRSDTEFDRLMVRVWQAELTWLENRPRAV